MKTIAISHTWPDIKNAEYEVLQRFINAAELAGAAVIVVDRNGTIIWHSASTSAIIGRTLRREQVEFLISLHFESPKVLDIYTYYALWQPLEFYSTFGYDRTIKSLSSNDDLLSCDSDLADAHGLNIFDAIGRQVPMPLPRVYHTLPQPFLEPNIGVSSTLFYVGINWERLGKAKGRFHDALVILASKGLVDIYGPELLLGAAPWEGFPSYQGELPFDGEAIKFAINRAGICLALSSKAHVDTGIMSNRLFEGFAGGAAVICNNNPFIAKHFANEVYLVDSEKGEEALAMQIVQIIRKIRADPAAAKEKVLRAQTIMREKFALEKNLESLFQAHEARRASLEATSLADTTVTVIADFRSHDLVGLDDFVDSLRCQTKASIVLHLLCDADGAPFAETSAKPSGSLSAVSVLPFPSAVVTTKFDGIQPLRVRRGGVVADILRKAETSYFAFARPSEVFFSNHFSKLAAALQRNENALMGVSSSIVTEFSLDKKTTKTLEQAMDGIEALILLESPLHDTGRFLFDRRLAKQVPESLFQLLDTAEHIYFQASAAVRGPVARTFQPTLDKNRQIEALLPVGDDIERQYIKDYLGCQPEWLRASAVAGASDRTNRNSQFDGQSAVERQPSNFPLLHPNQRYEAKQGGDGIIFLVAGFSVPEEDFVWCLERGIIDFSLPDVSRLESFSFTFRIALASRQSQSTGRPQHITVAFNGSVIGYYPTTGVDQVVAIHLPISKLPAGNRFRLELIPDYAEQVLSSEGKLLDPRRLSFRLSSFTLEQVNVYNLPRIDLEEVISFTRTGLADGMLVQNFYKPEDDLTWIAGTSARMQFYINDDVSRGRLNLSVRTRPALLTGEHQTLAVTLNGRELGAVELQPGFTSCSLGFETSLFKEDLVDIKLKIAHAEAVYDDAHSIVDPRLLGLGLCSMSIEKIGAEPSTLPDDDSDVSLEHGSYSDGDLGDQ